MKTFQYTIQWNEHQSIITYWFFFIVPSSHTHNTHTHAQRLLMCDVIGIEKLGRRDDYLTWMLACWWPTSVPIVQNWLFRSPKEFNWNSFMVVTVVGQEHSYCRNEKWFHRTSPKFGHSTTKVKRKLLPSGKKEI